MENCNEKIDILNREHFINRVLELVHKISENKGNMTFAINGEWGCGKTFVLEKIQERLDNDENKKFLVIPYNCWQYDYYEEPLVAIVSTLLDFLKKTKKVSPKKKEKIVTLAKQLGKVALSAGAHFVEYKTGVNLEKAVYVTKDIMDSFDAARSIDEKAYDSNFELKDTLKKLKKSFVNLLKDKTIVFCVDELDRCLPEYAIKVLERLHHVTEDVQNMVTILAVDKKRLEHTVNSIFGDESADKYLKKFIRFEIALDNGIQDTQGFFDKFYRFCEKFDASIYKKELNETKIDKFLKTLFQGIDIRSQEQIIEKASIVHELCFGTERLDHTIMYMELFYAVLWYHHKAKSIFNPKHAVFYNNPVFDEYEDIPKHFNDSWGVVPTAYIDTCTCAFPKKDSIAYRNLRRINIDSSDIFWIVFYYWYYLPHQRLTSEIPDSELYPKVEVEMEQFFRGNLKKLENFLYSLALID